MPLEIGVAGLTLLSVIGYGVLGGADFGGGIWDLLAWGPRRADQRAAIARAMGPVWEANHVWLILVIVLIFTCFPAAFSSLSIGLFVPFHLVLVGITLRGAAFVFRGSTPSRWGAVFGAGSVVTPFLLGMSLGAVSTGGLDWLSPLSWTVGALALSICAYLAAVYLMNETEGDLREDFRRRALGAGAVMAGLSILTIPVAYFDARNLWEGLIRPTAGPVVAAGAAAAFISGWALFTRRFKLARASAIAQASLLMAGWGLAQYPYIIFPEATLAGSAAPAATLRFVLISVPAGAALLAPSLAFLFRVFAGAAFRSK